MSSRLSSSTACLCVLLFSILLNLVVLPQSSHAVFTVKSIDDCYPKPSVNKDTCKTMIRDCYNKFNIPFKFVGTKACDTARAGCMCAEDCDYMTSCGEETCTGVKSCRWNSDTQTCVPRAGNKPSSNLAEICPAIAPAVTYLYPSKATYYGYNGFNVINDCMENRPAQCRSEPSCVAPFSMFKVGSSKTAPKFNKLLGVKTSNPNAGCFTKDNAPFVSALDGMIIREANENLPFVRSFVEAKFFDREEWVWTGAQRATLTSKQVSAACGNGTVMWSTAAGNGVVSRARSKVWAGKDQRTAPCGGDRSFPFVCACTTKFT